MTDSANADATRDDVREQRPQVDCQAAHAALVRLARSRAGLDFDEGVWLLAALRSEAHVRLGYGSFVAEFRRRRRVASILRDRRLVGLAAGWFGGHEARAHRFGTTAAQAAQQCREHAVGLAQLRRAATYLQDRQRGQRFGKVPQ